VKVIANAEQAHADHRQQAPEPGAQSGFMTEQQTQQWDYDYI
jgi:hypothetical protein